MNLRLQERFDDLRIELNRGCKVNGLSTCGVCGGRGRGADGQKSQKSFVFMQAIDRESKKCLLYSYRFEWKV